ncbi:TadE family type IV pilus minor pilin [Mycobacterium sp. IS-1590]|uniref:TadE family type IV pilus minor pilin n=1 Tax=Mycobacterium sp. IS-1590 TaxID=1772286 RepID=UPI0009EC45FE|nr:TadE family type IV pilus minor pilin [Mycobacterium sp. IS-1590]
MAALVAVLVVCLGGLTAVSMHIRCVDAAREAARLAARGHDGGATARDLAPEGATVVTRRDGEFVTSIVRARSPILPGFTVEARAVAALEPGSG